MQEELGAGDCLMWWLRCRKNLLGFVTLVLQHVTVVGWLAKYTYAENIAGFLCRNIRSGKVVS
jgi:hypothetical protein